MRLGILVTTALAFLLIATPTLAKDDRLEAGDAAPGLDIEEWLNGSETTLEEGNVYLIEFFTTKQRRIQQMVETLSDLQKELEHRGLIVLGISDEDAEDVRQFVTTQRNNLGFTVGVDRRGVTTREWRDKAGKEGPALFIVDRNLRIAWIGTSDSEAGPEILRRVLRGRFDAKLEQEAKPLLEAAQRNRKIKNWREAKRYYDQVIELDHTVFADAAFERFKMMLVDMDDPDAAYSYLRETLIGEWYAKDHDALQDVAEMITLDPDIPAEHRDLDLALEAAEAMQPLADRRDWTPLETLALVHFHRGEYREAVRWQKRAWMMARPKYKADLRRRLSSYQEAAARQSDER